MQQCIWHMITTHTHTRTHTDRHTLSTKDHNFLGSGSPIDLNFNCNFQRWIFVCSWFSFFFFIFVFFFRFLFLLKSKVNHLNNGGSFDSNLNELFYRYIYIYTCLYYIYSYRNNIVVCCFFVCVPSTAPSLYLYLHLLLPNFEFGLSLTIVVHFSIFRLYSYSFDVAPYRKHLLKPTANCLLYSYKKILA